ncbi:hypothetical protein BHM03_00056679, partial [Ensete ventricosum]
PKLGIRKGSNTWCHNSVLGISLPFHSHPKQFLQLLKRSSLNSTVISTTIDHPLISSRIATGYSFQPYCCCNLVIFIQKTQKNLFLFYCINFSS